MRTITILLLFVIVVLAGSFPSVISQSFTTVTNVLTTTGLFTTNIYSTNTIGTTTQTVETMNTFMSTTDTIQSEGGRFCFFSPWNITVDPGTTEVTGTIGPPSSKIDFYIMNQQQYNLFNHSTCGNTPNDAEVAVYSLSSTYALDWKNPPPGWYYFIFSNTNSAASTVTTPFTLIATLNQAQTSTAYNVVTNQATLPATQTLTSIQVTQVSTSPGLSLDPTVIAGIAIAIVAVLGALFLAKSREGKKGRKVEGKMFCINCGASLPIGSKFCNKCGKTPTMLEASPE